MESLNEPVVEKEGSSDAVAPKKRGNNKYGRRGKPLSTKRVSDLQSMRYILSNNEFDDKTHQHKEMRKWLMEDRRGFMAQKLRLEDEERNRARFGGGDKEPDRATAPDETVEELRKLIGKMLTGVVDEADDSVIAGGLVQVDTAGVAGKSTDA